MPSFNSASSSSSTSYRRRRNRRNNSTSTTTTCVVAAALMVVVATTVAPLILLSHNNGVTAWTTTTTTTGSSVSSSFAGTTVLVTKWKSDSSSSYNNNNRMHLTMKKGKPNVPVNMRSQYRKQMEMAQMQQQIMKAQSAGQDGLPVFNLFVRSKKGGAKMWYPCGSFKGDEKSAALAKSYADGGMLSGISKKQLDGGVAGSLYQDQTKLAESICRTYPQLRKSRDNFEFGYKLSFEGLSDEQSKEMCIVEPKEQKGVVDSIKNIFS